MIWWQPKCIRKQKDRRWRPLKCQGTLAKQVNNIPRQSPGVEEQVEDRYSSPEVIAREYNCDFARISVDAFYQHIWGAKSKRAFMAGILSTSCESKLQYPSLEGPGLWSESCQKGRQPELLCRWCGWSQADEWEFRELVLIQDSNDMNRGQQTENWIRADGSTNQ